jgi:hypothetical protein
LIARALKNAKQFLLFLIGSGRHAGGERVGKTTALHYQYPFGFGWFAARQRYVVGARKKRNDFARNVLFFGVAHVFLKTLENQFATCCSLRKQ